MTTSKRLFCVLLTFLMTFSPGGIVWADEFKLSVQTDGGRAVGW